MATKRIEQLVKSVNSRLQPVMEFDRFYAALYDPIRSLIEFPWVAQDGKSIEWATRPYQATSWLLDSIVHTKASRLIEQDIEQELAKDNLKCWPEGDLPKSWLAVPMIIEDCVIGVLVAENRRKSRVFGENGLRVLSSVVRQIAQAIENARLVDQREHKIASLRALYEMGQQLNSEVRSEESKIIQLIYTQACKLMDTDNLYIALYDEATDTVRFPLMFVNGKLTQVPSRSGGQSRTEWIIHNRESILIETRAESAPWYKDHQGTDYLDGPFASWVGVPMIAGDKVLGVIATYHKTQDYIYTRDDQEILSLMANQAAVAIENARLYDHLEDMVQERTQQLQKRNEQLAALQEIGVDITSQHTLTDVLGSIVEHSNQIMHADFSTLFPYNAKLDRFDNGIRRGQIEIKPSIPNKQGYSESIAKTQAPLFIEDAEHAPGVKSTFIENKHVKSFAGVPLVAKGETVGVLYVNYLEPHLFSEDEQATLRHLAGQAAVAIENARLYSNLEERVKERTQKLEEANTKIAQKEALLVRGMLAADFVHRLNNLAGTIPIWVSMIREEIAQPLLQTQEIGDFLDKIQRDTNGLLRAAEQLNEPPIEQNVDVVFVLQSMLRQVRIQYHKSIKVVEEIEPNLAKVWALPLSLISALSNIVSNGVEAVMSLGGGTLTVRACNHLDNSGRKLLKIEIQDNGGGVSRENIDKLFVPFFSTKGGGRGYGLWRAKAVVEELGGSITVESEFGVGTAFTVILPTTSQEE
jgi:GAF domain-containing protein